MTTIEWMRSLLNLDAEIEFQVTPSGRLRMGPGDIRCRVGWGNVRSWTAGMPDFPDTDGPEEGAWIEGRVEIADSKGRIFTCSRLVSVYSIFVVAATAGRPLAPRATVALVADDVHGNFDLRDEQLVMSAKPGGAPFVYRLRHSFATISLAIDRTRDTSDGLVVTVGAEEDRGPRETATPSATYVTELAAALVLVPAMVDEFQRHSGRPRSSFWRSDKVGPPDELVRFLE